MARFLDISGPHGGRIFGRFLTPFRRPAPSVKTPCDSVDRFVAVLEDTVPVFLTFLIHMVVVLWFSGFALVV